MIKKISKDKRILFIYLFVIIGLSLGFTYAASSTSLGMNIATALISVDEDAYGDTSINTAAIDFRPILDTDVDTNTENVIKIEFLVGGASTNTASNVIYDIALVDLDLDCDLISPYIKWKLVKDGTELSNGSLDIGIVNDRLVLTEIQEDLPSYSATKEGYHSYTFYMWFSDSCQASDAVSCIDAEDQSDLLGKYFKAKIEVELYTGSKVGYGPIDERADSVVSSCDSGIGNYSLLSDVVEPGDYVKYTGNNGCTGGSCSGQNVSSSSFYYEGWRVGYIENGSTHLISAGAPEFLSTDENGVASSEDSSDGGVEDETLHYANLDNAALRYCNSNLVYGGECNSDSVWAFSGDDLVKIDNICSNESEDPFYWASNADCGAGNDLIDVGDYYWVNQVYPLYWEPNVPYMDWNYGSYEAMGVRPVVKLDNLVIVTGGTGTEEDPYTIANKDNLLLSDIAKPGDYIAYTGNNGCEGESCEGQNANYVDENNTGWCIMEEFYSNNPSNGWRLAYVEDGIPYLISAGATDCVATLADGTISINTGGYASSKIQSASDMYKHINNLNNTALKYCNKNFAYGGKCNLSTAWAMNNVDFQQITGSELSSTSCLYDYGATDNGAGTYECGTGNDLIDNGIQYWFASDVNSIWMYFWHNEYGYHNVSDDSAYGASSNWDNGVRPVLKLADTIIVTGGTGTEDDPYTIANKDNLLLSDIAKPGDYVKYTGTNGCTGEFCNGRNANYVDEDNKGYCFNNNYQFLYDGWRVGYIENGSTHLISAGAPECLSTDENGVPSNTDSSTWYEDGVQHFDNANAIALKYCNSRLASGGKCNLNSVWAFTRTDAERIDSSFLNGGCVQGSCGIGNDLIDNGGYYWFNDDNGVGACYYWEPYNEWMDYNYLSNYALGVRPVIKLDDSVIVVRGSGTSDDPYIIGN